MTASATDRLPPVERVLQRDPRALGRALSALESRDPGRGELLRAVGGGRARRVGITGPPGAGKSTLVDRLIGSLRETGLEVAVLAVDPTSPYSGGAILGDRVRMHRHYTDPGVYIRSMATRGAMGGLAGATRDAVALLDGAGFDWVLVETVGVGQDEVDVIGAVDTVAVVTLPGLGDDIQAIKAGVLEVADLFVINKSDLEGAERTRRDLETMLDMGPRDQRRPEIVMTVAHRGEGIDEVLAALARHHDWLRESGTFTLRRREQLRVRVEALVVEEIAAMMRRDESAQGELDEAVEAGEDPYAAARRITAALLHGRKTADGGAASDQKR